MSGVRSVTASRSTFTKVYHLNKMSHAPPRAVCCKNLRVCKKISKHAGHIFTTMSGNMASELQCTQVLRFEAAYGWPDWSLASVSWVASALNISFSYSNRWFLSSSSLICSLRTSTSSRTANIRWLLTRSYNITKRNFKKFINY